MSGDLGQNFSIANFGGEASGADAGVQAVLARRHMELPAMPRTGYNITAECPLPERASGVRANAVQHMESAVDVIDSENPPIGDNFPAGAGRNFTGIDERNPGH